MPLGAQNLHICAPHDTMLCVSHAKKISNIKQLRGDLSFRGFYDNLSFKTVEGAVLNFMVFVHYVSQVYFLLLFFWDKKLMCIKLILLLTFCCM